MTFFPPSARRFLGVLLPLGLFIRLGFIFVGARLVYPGADGSWKCGDTFSFIWSWENLWLHGRYTFDFLEPDAAFGRLPGYPLFYGLHYLLFGAANAIRATQISQALLDTLAIAMAFGIGRRLAPTSRWAPYLAALVYCFNPFPITWISIISTECLATILTVTWAYVLLAGTGGRWNAVVVALVIVAAFYVREYLGFFLPLSALYWLLKARRERGAGTHAWLGVPVSALRAGTVATVVFLALYSLWPIRNYALQHRVVLVKTKTAGYALFNTDYYAFRGWVLCWATDVDPLVPIVSHGRQLNYPAAAHLTPAQRAEADRGTRLAYQCGSSFWLDRNKVYGNKTGRYRDTTWMRAQTAYWNHCNDSVAAPFDRLRAAYIRDYPLEYWFRVPLLTLREAIIYNPYFGKGLGPLSLYQLFFALAAAARSVLLGLAFLLCWRQRAETVPLVGFAICMMLMLSFLIRFIEFRYMLQADALLLLVVAAGLAPLLDRFSGASAPVVPAAPYQAALPVQ